MTEIICPYKDKCTQYPNFCNTCRRNTGKRSYYDPELQPYYPYYPDSTPWHPYPPNTTWWCITT